MGRQARLHAAAGRCPARAARTPRIAALTSAASSGASAAAAAATSGMSPRRAALKLRGGTWGWGVGGGGGGQKCAAEKACNVTQVAWPPAGLAFLSVDATTAAPTTPAPARCTINPSLVCLQASHRPLQQAAVQPPPRLGQQQRRRRVQVVQRQAGADAVGVVQAVVPHQACRSGWQGGGLREMLPKGGLDPSQLPAPLARGQLHVQCCWRGQLHVQRCWQGQLPVQCCWQGQPHRRARTVMHALPAGAGLHPVLLGSEVQKVVRIAPLAEAAQVSLNPAGRQAGGATGRGARGGRAGGPACANCPGALPAVQQQPLSPPPLKQRQAGPAALAQRQCCVRAAACTAVLPPGPPGDNVPQAGRRLQRRQRGKSQPLVLHKQVGRQAGQRAVDAAGETHEGEGQGQGSASVWKCHAQARSTPACHTSHARPPCLPAAAPCSCTTSRGAADGQRETCQHAHALLGVCRPRCSAALLQALPRCFATHPTCWWREYSPLRVPTKSMAGGTLTAAGCAPAGASATAGTPCAETC